MDWRLPLTIAHLPLSCGCALGHMRWYDGRAHLQERKSPAWGRRDKPVLFIPCASIVPLRRRVDKNRPFDSKMAIGSRSFRQGP